ncbi:MAG TPA: TIGR03000 domain-containing protein [Gemmataceae bacterium]|nr:TIGR03000 domain-containing protein [Gemmataceae bacterium]
MYSVVLMMALSGGANGPAWHDATGEHVAKYGDNSQKAYRCHGCHGCHGCYGCYGGCHGCYGGCYGCYGGCGGCYGCGCYGGYGYSYGSMPYATGYGYAMSNGNLPAGYSYGDPANAGNRYGDDNGTAPATIVVRLPADATLTVDGAATTSTQGVRTFVSPPLQAGKDFQYTLRAEATRNGKKINKTQEVTVRAGRESEVTIDLPSTGGSSDN